MQEKDFDQETTGKYVPKLESAQVVLVHCNLVNTNYQQAPRVLFTLMPDKKFGQLVTVVPHPLMMLKTNNTESESIEVLFTDQNKRPHEIKDNVNITIIIGTGEYKWDFDLIQVKYVDGCGFLSFARNFWDKYGKKLMDNATKTGKDAGKLLLKVLFKKQNRQQEI